MSERLKEFERREAPRRARIIGARILTVEGLTIGDSTVCNLSPAGAMLRSPDSEGLEGGFCLLVDGEAKTRRCVIAWKSGNQLGVWFVRPDATEAAIASELLGREAMRTGGTQLSG